jgi:hypothetical protein
MISTYLSIVLVIIIPSVISQSLNTELCTEAINCNQIIDTLCFPDQQNTGCIDANTTIFCTPCSVRYIFLEGVIDQINYRIINAVPSIQANLTYSLQVNINQLNELVVTHPVNNVYLDQSDISQLFDSYGNDEPNNYLYCYKIISRIQSMNIPVMGGSTVCQGI